MMYRVILLFLVAVSIECKQGQSLIRRHSLNQDVTACGTRKISTRGLIVGGLETVPGEWPWHAAVFEIQGGGRDRKYKCGGTLIGAKFVLTTASCAGSRGRGKNSTKVVELGQYDLMESSLHKVDVTVKRVIVHERYVSGDPNNDVAVLELKHAVNFTDYIQPVCLPEEGEKIEQFGSKTGTIVGWGFKEYGVLADKLQSAQVPIISFIDCLQSDPDFFGKHFNSGMFCAGRKNGTAPCFGDSGGGMFFKEKRGWILRGITSFTNIAPIGECNTQHYFGLVNVVHYLGWIKNATVQSRGNRKESSLSPVTVISV